MDQYIKAVYSLCSRKTLSVQEICDVPQPGEDSLSFSCLPVRAAGSEKHCKLEMVWIEQMNAMTDQVCQRIQLGVSRSVRLKVW